MKNPKHQTHTTKYIKITKNGKLDKRILTAQTAVPAPYSYKLAITTPRSTTPQLGHLWCDHLDFIEKRENVYNWLILYYTGTYTCLSSYFVIFTIFNIIK